MAYVYQFAIIVLTNHGIKQKQYILTVLEVTNLNYALLASLAQSSHCVESSLLWRHWGRIYFLFLEMRYSLVCSHNSHCLHFHFFPLRV